jgi:nicotinamidase/pyrazinamidase
MSVSSNPIKSALIIVDMQKDNVGRYCKDIIPQIQSLIRKAREKKMPIIFACDSRYPDDSLFERIGIKIHTIKGTEGAEVIDKFAPSPEDMIVEKRMLSAFFGTDLDFTLREKEIKKLIITGVRTEFCFLKTVLDAFELGYEVIVPIDSCASPSKEGHEAVLTSLDLLKIKKPTTKELLQQL